MNVNKLRKNGELDNIKVIYSKLLSLNKYQDSSLFFFMNEELIYYLENAIRSLGNEYKCFSMPFWDFTVDAGIPNQNKPIFNTKLGLYNDDNFCVKSIDDIWNICKNDKDKEIDSNILCYWIPNDDKIISNSSDSCLKRFISNTQILPTSAQIAFSIENNDNFIDFTKEIKLYFDYVYAFFSSSQSLITIDDPIYPLFIGSSPNSIKSIECTKSNHHPLTI